MFGNREKSNILFPVIDLDRLIIKNSTELDNRPFGTRTIGVTLGSITEQFDWNRPFSKMAAENLSKSKLKTNTSTRKSILNLVTLPSFSISGKISAGKMYVENCKNYRRLYDWGYNTPSHTNVCNFYNFQRTFSQLIFHLKY